MYGILDVGILVSLFGGVTICIGIRISSNTFKQVYMKTPMQELIEQLKELQDTQDPYGLHDAIEFAESMLEKEKEFMNGVWLDGRNSRTNGQDPIKQIKNL